MLVAFDDTDGPGGGCTTYLAGLVLDEIGPRHQAGPARLVRLNPDNPYKTRGNAAVVLELVDDLDPEAVLKTTQSVVAAHARVAEGKGAGIAVFDRPPDPSWYERGVTEQIPLEAARRALAEVPTATLGTGRGLVGALCAAAWRPGEHATWTRIAYRHPDRWGTPRQVDPASVRALAAGYPETFDCWDPHNEHPVMVPRTPCPVLFGLRATRPDRLEEAAGKIVSEPVHRATTFVTNQATDDHLDAARLDPVTIAEEPEALPGGHVRARARWEGGDTVELVAFEPTGRLRDALRAVEVGDRVLPLGSRKEGQVNLEKLLHVPAERSQPTTCPGCGGRMGSTGAGGPRRCPRCGVHRAPEVERAPPRWHEVDPSARRHLARPLALGLAPHVARAARALVEGGDRRPMDPEAAR